MLRFPAARASSGKWVRLNSELLGSFDDFFSHPPEIGNDYGYRSHRGGDVKNHASEQDDAYYPSGINSQGATGFDTILIKEIGGTPEIAS
jgi:hypothetical protein